MDVKERLLADLRRRGYLAGGAGAGCGLVVTRWGEPAWRAVPAAGEAGAAQAQDLAQKTLYLKIAHTGQAGSEKILPVLNMFPGRTKTVIYYADTGARMVGRCMPEEIMLQELRMLLGEKNVVLK